MAGSTTAAGLEVDSGTLTLSGTSTFSGPTNLYGGLLKAGAVNALSPNSAVTVFTGGALDATGFAPDVGPLTVNAGGTLNLSVGDLLTSNGAASFGGTLNLFGAVGNLPEALITYSGLPTGMFGSVSLNGSSLPLTDLSCSSGSLDIVSLGPPPPSVWTGTVNNSWKNAGTGRSACPMPPPPGP